ncbi:hypothetical protein NPIL_473701 [Nephila pilipes]|uniref:Uncharacterized protein n=1 Tax=Nephila pilipes TaxID=299642 RepID=A0A8X6T963_NEPPI|nr:hypothetical protein NPIL_473701 [Nephila pilipes]
MLLYGFVHAYSANVKKYLGIQGARSKNSNHQALDSSTYTSILWDPYLHQKVFVTASPVLIGSPNVSFDLLKPTYVPKELVDIPAVVHRKEKVSSQPNEVLDTGEEKSIGSSSRQETTTRSSRRVKFNFKYS